MENKTLTPEQIQEQINKKYQLPENVASKYEALRPGRHQFPKIGLVDFSKMTLAQAEAIADKHPDYLKKKTAEDKAATKK